MAQFRDVRQVADFNFGVITTELCVFYRKLTVNGYKRTIKLMLETISKFMRATNSQLLGGLIMSLLQEVQQLEKKFMMEVGRLEEQKKEGGIGTPGTPGQHRGAQASPALGPQQPISSMSMKMPNLFFQGPQQTPGTPGVRQLPGNTTGTPLQTSSPGLGRIDTSTPLSMDEMKKRMKKFFTKVKYIMTNCGHYNRYYSKSMSCVPCTRANAV